MPSAPAQKAVPPLHIIELDRFRVPYAADEQKRAYDSRRFLTLFLPKTNETLMGGTAKALQVCNCLGESFCFKVLRQPTGFDGREDERARAFETRSKAFSYEYSCQSALRGIPGIPLIYGYGLYAGGPVMLMEWVHGVSLRKGLLPRAAQLRCGISLRTLSALGASIAGILCAARVRDPYFVHRDISGMNVLIRTDKTGLNQQISDGVFDLRLIDFGSAICGGIAAERRSADPKTQRIWRNATPEYAPPEMLSHHTEALVGQRDSEAIDVYELCSVLYELYCGTTPYQLSSNKPDDYYGFKMRHCPPTPRCRRQDDDAFIELIMQGLRQEQSLRPSLVELRYRMQEICRAYDDALASSIASNYERMVRFAQISLDSESTDLARG